MIVVADTSPLNYLVQIDEVELLPALFDKVLIPLAVVLELTHAGSPLKVRKWISSPPGWLESRQVAGVASPSLFVLEPGEREAIQLALETGIDTVLIDDAAGRLVAETFKLDVRGTLGVLERAAKLGKISFHQALVKLELTSFRISPTLRAAFLQRNL
jgi:predicted nucleic acid-binding protein